jgi:hypothetical protein
MHATLPPGRAGAALVCALCACGVARAEPWLAPGDLGLRHDVRVLADLGVLRGPASTWPLSWGDIADDLATADLASLDDAARASLTRLTKRVQLERRAQGFVPSIRVSLQNEPRRVRTFEQTPREDEELETGIAWTGLRFSYRLQGSFVSDPDDDESARLDGSYFGAASGNWMFNVGAMDRWWGPGWNGSLILSSNARPIPMISVNRNLSDPLPQRWLRWTGPWSLTAMMGQLESDRDVPDALFFGTRISFRPVPSLEVGLSRTAQWCGEGRPCDLSTFWDLLVGNDTRGVTTTLPEEPGNQLAGADLRWTGGPHGRRYAVYGQMIAEDIAGGAPSKYIGLFGAERWGYIKRLNGSYRVNLEWADTAVDFLGQDQFNTAYEHGIYTDGYRYRGRATGHSLDNDGRLWTLQATLLPENGRTWNGLLQFAEINRDDSERGPHSVSATAADLWNVEVGYGMPFGRGTLSMSAGFERFEHKTSGETDESPRLFVQWKSGL